MNNISFANPWLLFIALPLVAAVTVPFVITVKRDNANAHNITSLILHLVICACITLAFAGMTFERVVTETNVYVLADISYSADDNLNEVQANVQKIAQKLPKNSKMGVICFGRNYQLLSNLGDPVPDVRSAANVDRSATDIASALRYAGNLFEEGVIKRIIVITDGAETVASNSILKVVSTLQDNDVYVDAVYLDDNIKPSVRELQVDGADATPSTYLNKQEEVNILVRANCGEDENARIDGYVSLLKDGEVLERRAETFYNGLNTVTMKLPTDIAGTFRYEVRVSTVADGDDKSDYNNNYYLSQTVSTERKVLFIGATYDDCYAGELIYGTDNVDYIYDPAQVPRSVEELCVYDEIALSNFDVRTVEGATMFMSSLTTLVNEYGKTLATYGNTFVQDEEVDSGVTPLTMLADLMPVKIGNVETDTRLFAIVFDISLSMNFQGRFEVAKKAAIEFLKVLNPTDSVMVIGFSGGVTEMLPPTPLTVPSIIIDRINECKAENGTYLSEALRYTEELMPKRFHDKQVILISDGLNPKNDNDEAVSIARRMSENNVAVSAIGIYPQTVNGMDGDRTLRNIVYNRYQTARSFYKAINNESEVDMIIEGITDETRQIKIEGDKYEVKIQSKEEVTEGVTRLNAVEGFWYNSAKSTATTVLTATYFRDRVTSFDVPLYAYWRSGKGKVVSFTSDIAGDWTMSGFAAGDGGIFYENIPAATLPDEKIVSPFIVSVESEGGIATVRVAASPTLKNTTDFAAIITDPRGLVSSKNLSFNASVYAANFNVDLPGTYKIRLEYRDGEKTYSTDAEFSVPYYAEYDAFATYSKSYLYRITTEYGEILDLDGISTIENSYSAYTSYVFSFTLPLMIACAALFIIEVIVRQLKWKDITSFFKGIFGRRV